MAHVDEGITQFYLPSKHEPHLPLLLAAVRHGPLAGTHFAFQQQDGQVGLTWMAGSVPR